MSSGIILPKGTLRVSACELEKRVAITKSDLNQMSQQLQMGKPPLCPMDNPTLRTLQKIMEKKER